MGAKKESQRIQFIQFIQRNPFFSIRPKRPSASKVHSRGNPPPPPGGRIESI